MTTNNNNYSNVVAVTNEPNLTISHHIKTRLESKGIRYFANDNISDVLLDGDTELLIDEVESKVRDLLQSLVIDVDNDHNSKDTPRRLAKMYINEIFSGRYKAMPTSTEFPNVANLDSLYLVGPITLNSTCSHHHQNIQGVAYIGIVPRTEVIGLSKFNRLANWIAKRPSIQEETTVKIVELLNTIIQPKGLICLIRAKHLCCAVRGVSDPNTEMVTHHAVGVLKTDTILINQFFELIRLANSK